MNEQQCLAILGKCRRECQATDNVAELAAKLSPGEVPYAIADPRAGRIDLVEAPVSGGLAHELQYLGIDLADFKGAAVLSPRDMACRDGEQDANEGFYDNGGWHQSRINSSFQQTV